MVSRPPSYILNEFVAGLTVELIPSAEEDSSCGI